MAKILPLTGVQGSVDATVVVVNADGSAGSSTVPGGSTPGGSAMVDTVGARYNAAPATKTEGQIDALQTDDKGSLNVVLKLPNSNSNVAAGTMGSDGLTASTNTLRASAGLYALNGTSFDRVRTIQDPATTGLGVLATALAPQTSAGGAIVPVATTVAAASLIGKASGGNLYSVNVCVGATAGYLMLFDSATVPADGTVTPKFVMSLAANTSFTTDWDLPVRFSTGCTAVFSSTGPFTKTASATAFIALNVV